jgi:hypothetical protein
MDALSVQNVIEDSLSVRRATSGQVAILRGPLAVFMADMQTIKAESIDRIQQSRALLRRASPGSAATPD